jgi:hypothetical protein
MSVLKRTFALPRDTVQSFEKTVPTGKRSATVANLIEGWLDKRKRAALRQAVIEGCHEMAEEYVETEREYHALEEEVHREVDRPAQTRRRGSRAPRSR